MPALSELGTDYTSFPVHFGGDGGYEVRVIAVADNTDITVPAFSTSLTLNMGEFHVIENNVTRQGFKISCNQPCLVVQYMRGLPSGGPSGLHMSSFLAVLIPEDRATSSLIFTVPRLINHSTFAMAAAISIITNTYPGTGLYLNDLSLANLDWQPVEAASNWFATVEIDAGFHELFSTVASERYG